MEKYCRFLLGARSLRKRWLNACKKFHNAPKSNPNQKSTLVMAEKKKYRSSAWYNSKSHRRDTFIHRGWMRNQGHPNHLFDGRPVIGICNTWSELTPCNGHFREIAESVKKGVYVTSNCDGFSGKICCILINIASSM